MKLKSNWILILLLMIILFNIIPGCILTNENNDENNQEIKSVNVNYKIKVEYNGTKPYVIKVPLFIDENEDILKINDKFKPKYGEISKYYNQTQYGPALLISSNQSFFIEINETYKSKYEFTNNSISLSLVELNNVKYWIYSDVAKNQSINLSLYKKICSIKENDTIKGMNFIQYNGNILNGWNLIQVKGKSITE